MGFKTSDNLAFASVSHIIGINHRSVLVARAPQLSINASVTVYSVRVCFAHWTLDWSYITAGGDFRPLQSVLVGKQGFSVYQALFSFLV